MLKIIIILMAISSFIFAKVTASIDSMHPIEGQLLTLDIIAIGNDISFPEINQINGSPILSISSSSSLSVINGKKSNIKTKSLSFYMQENMIIPSYIVKVDGKNYKTQKIKLNTSKPNRQHQDIEITLEIDKKDLYLSELTTLRLFIKRRASFNMSDISLKKPKLSDFYIQNTKNNNPYRQGDYIIQETSYDIYPKKVGQLLINNFIAIMTVSSREKNSFSFSDIDIEKQIESNSLNINVRDMPSKINIVGDFNFTTTANKLKTKANDSISLELIIKGKGNLEDIEKFELDINNASSYASKPKIRENTFSQMWSIVADENFTIPSIKFSFFSLKDKKVITKESKAIDIIITGKKNNKVKINSKIQEKRKIIYRGASLKEKVLYVLLGLSIGIIILIVHNIIRSILKKIKYKKKLKIPKDDKELLILLIGYKNDERIKKYINKLEENIYNNAKNKINKKELSYIINSYK